MFDKNLLPELFGPNFVGDKDDFFIVIIDN